LLQPRDEDRRPPRGASTDDSDDRPGLHEACSNHRHEGTKDTRVLNIKRVLRVLQPTTPGDRRQRHRRRSSTGVPDVAFVDLDHELPQPTSTTKRRTLGSVVRDHASTSTEASQLDAVVFVASTRRRNADLTFETPRIPARSTNARRRSSFPQPDVQADAARFTSRAFPSTVASIGTPRTASSFARTSL